MRILPLFILIFLFATAFAEWGSEGHFYKFTKGNYNSYGVADDCAQLLIASVVYGGATAYGMCVHTCRDNPGTECMDCVSGSCMYDFGRGYQEKCYEDNNCLYTKDDGTTSEWGTDDQKSQCHYTCDEQAVEVTKECGQKAKTCGSVAAECENFCPGEQLPYPLCSCIEEQDACENYDCPNICDSSVGTLFFEGRCEPNPFDTDEPTCVYEYELPCQYCSADGTICLENCENGMDDNADGLADCEDPLCATSYHCTCIKEVNNGDFNKLNVVFIGDNFERYDEMKRDAEFSRYLTNAMRAFRHEPFSSNYNKINVYATRISPSENLAYAMAKCGTNQNDQYIYIDATSTSKNSNADICGNKARIYTVQAGLLIDRYVLHEFGHSFGCLWDEYTYRENSDSVIGLTVDFWYELAYLKHMWTTKWNPQANCAISESSEGCNNYFSPIAGWGGTVDCNKGCTSPDWWRSSEKSVMYSASKYSDYNSVSQELVRKRLQRYTG